MCRYALFGELGVVASEWVIGAGRQADVRVLVVNRLIASGGEISRYA